MDGWILASLCNGVIGVRFCLVLGQSFNASPLCVKKLFVTACCEGKERFNGADKVHVDMWVGRRVKGPVAAVVRRTTMMRKRNKARHRREKPIPGIEKDN